MGIMKQKAKENETEWIDGIYGIAFEWCLYLTVVGITGQIPKPFMDAPSFVSETNHLSHARARAVVLRAHFNDRVEISYWLGNLN